MTENYVNDQYKLLREEQRMNAAKFSAKCVVAVLLLSVWFVILTCTPSSKPSAPPGLGYHAMAYDAESGVIVLFGGQLRDYSMISTVSATWVYDCAISVWKRMDPSEKPPAAAGHAMAYDAESDRVVLFCGETWAYDYNSNTWEKSNPGRAPVAAFGYSMVYDAESDRIVLFGVPSTDTWVYDLNSDTWTAMKPAISPPRRQFQSMAYDAESDRVVLFGGGAYGGGTLSASQDYADVLDDTWAYDYNTNSWKELKPATRPEKRVFHAMTYDSAIDRVVLFGGWSYDSGIQIDNKLWVYDLNGNSWETIEVKEKLTPVRKHTMAYVAKENSIVIYGGISGPPQKGGEPPFTKDLWTIRL
jgi:N-acetylneuraminic acid mutarotase